MPQLLTRNQAESEQLVEELSKTIFQSPTNFLAAYEQGWVNRNNDEIKSIANRIVDVYQNVQFKGRDIIFVSQAEVMVDEVIDGLQPWRTITKLKRAVADAHDQSKHGDTVYFTVDNAGYVLYKNDAGELVKLTSEKLFRNTAELQPIYTRYSSFAAETPNPEELLADSSENEDTEEPVGIVNSEDEDSEEEDNDGNPFLDDEDDDDETVDNSQQTQRKGSSENSAEVGAYKFKVADLTSIDDSFIEEIYALFEKNV